MSVASDSPIIAWLKRVGRTETPSSNIRAFNIGLIETAEGYSAYLIGSQVFDPDDDDWACDVDFEPQEKYCALPKEDTASWDVIQDRVVAAVRSFLASEPEQNCFLALAEGVTIGFDDGELVRVK